MILNYSYTPEFYTITTNTTYQKFILVDLINKYTTLARSYYNQASKSKDDVNEYEYKSKKLADNLAKFNSDKAIELIEEYLINYGVQIYRIPEIMDLAEDIYDVYIENMEDYSFDDVLNEMFTIKR